MHYNENAWTGGTKYKSIIAINPADQKYLKKSYNRKSGFSELDIKQIRLMYKCNGRKNCFHCFCYTEDKWE